MMDDFWCVSRRGPPEDEFRTMCNYTSYELKTVGVYNSVMDDLWCVLKRASLR